MIEDAKMKPTVKAIEGEEIIHFAAIGKQLNVIKYLIKNQHVDPNSSNNKVNYGPLHYSARVGCKECVEFLVEEAKVEINTRSKFNTYTPIVEAAINKRLDVVMVGFSKIFFEIESDSFRSIIFSI